MNILNPFFLGFLALALIPLVLYLIFRLRRNEVAWGATYILKLTLSQKRKQNIWKQICILTLRTIALALLVLAFARPFRPQEQTGGDYPHGPERLHRVVLIDNSQSMMAASGPQTRLDVARGVMASLMTSLRTGDTCHIIPMSTLKAGEPAAAEAVACPLNADKAATIASQVTPSPQPIDLSAALRAAISEFRDVAAPQRQLVILTDLCRADYPAIANFDMLGEQLKALKVRTATLNLGSRDVPNMAVESLTSGSELFLPGQFTNIYVNVTNYGDTKSPDTQVKLQVDGKPLADQELALPPGGRKTLVFPVTLDAGKHRLEARLTPDAFPADDAIQTFVSAKPDLDVLMVFPFDPKVEGFEKEAEFLTRALDAAAEMPYHLKIKTLGSNNFLAQDVAGHDVVILCGIDDMPKPNEVALEQFVRHGGLIISPGAATNAQKLNETCRTLLPAELDEPLRPAVDVERYVTVQTAEIGLPLLHEFEDSKAGDLDAARIYNYFRVKPVAAAAAPGPGDTGGSRAARTLLSFVSGAPLLLERSYGKGTVLLWTTTLGGAWNSLPVHHAYLPLLVRLINFAAGFSDFPRNVAAGDPLIADVTSLPSGDLFITTPDAKLLSCPTVVSGSHRFIRFEETQAPGSYELQDQAGKVLASFSVARSYHESDLRMLEKTETARLEESLDTKIAPDEKSLRGAMWRPGDGWEMTGWFVLAALLLVALDALLTWSWFR